MYAPPGEEAVGRATDTIKRTDYHKPLNAPPGEEAVGRATEVDVT